MEWKHIAVNSGRLSTILKEEMGMSSGLMNRLKWKSLLFVNGQPQHTDYPVQSGDLITVPLDAPVPEYPAENGVLHILYEDEHILAVDKPAKMLIHPSRSQFTGTLANRVLGYYQSTGQNCAFHPITRLDRDTFGIVLLAKNAHIHARLQSGDLRKTYHTLVYGAPEQNGGRIDAPIARKPLPSLLREIHPTGKPALTLWQVLQRHNGYTKLSLQPVTGRTHQLRLHCAHMGFPILGDPQYGSPESQNFSAALGFSYQQLCAYKLEFTHPVTAAPMCLVSCMDV